jgi:hypothetical protein
VTRPDERLTRCGKAVFPICGDMSHVASLTGVPQSHPAAVVENAALRAEVVRAGHGLGHREPVRISLARSV